MIHCGPVPIGPRSPKFHPRPEFATVTDGAPAVDGWLHEIKLGLGYPTAARLEAGKVHMLTRSGLDWIGALPADQHGPALP